MEKAFFAGLIIGAMGGALIVLNNNKARKAVYKGQEELKKQMDNLSQKLEKKDTTEKASK